MRRSEIGLLDSTRTYWAVSVISPVRDWAGAPGCRRGARFLVDGHSFRPSRDEFETFDSRLDCLSWILSHRAELNRGLSGASVRAVPLDRWLLGLE